MTATAPTVREFVIGNRDGFRGVNKKDVAPFVAVLSDIAKKIGPPGEIPAFEWRKELLARAKPKDSPIHNKFTWDDNIAGEKYRHHQAAYYIRAFDFQYVDERGKAAKKVRWLQTIKLVKSDGQAQQRAPMTMPDVLSDERALENVVETALGEMQSWVRRYEALESVAKLAPIFRAARKVLAKTVVLKK